MYLGSSFSFIPVILLIISNHSYEYAISGFFAVGLLLTLIGILIKYTGVKQINDILPLAAIAPIVAIIGLNLIPNTFKQARLITMTDFTVISINCINYVSNYYYNINFIKRILLQFYWV